MTNYLTTPVHEHLDGVQDDVLIEGWLSSQQSPVADELGWDTLKKLRSVSYGIYLSFEQGRNCPPMALAWRDQPELDLADYDDVGYELHAVGQPGHRAEPAPSVITRFHDPIEAFVSAMAERTDMGIAEILPRIGGFVLDLEHGTLRSISEQRIDALMTAASYQIARFIYARIEENMVLRPRIHDEDTGRFLGHGQDVAPGLRAGWDLQLAARPR